jgi:hypothetical protein
MPDSLRELQNHLLLLAAIYLQKKADSGKPFHGLAFAIVDFNNNWASVKL